MLGSRSSREALLGLSCVLSLSAFLGVGKLVARPDQTHTIEAVTGEFGNLLYRADALSRGMVLYEDVACQYGALPVHAHAAFSRLVGTSINTTWVFHLLASSIVVVVAYFVALRAVGPRDACLWACAAVLPATLTPGGAYGGYAAVEFPSFERLCLLLLVVLWTPPASRSNRRSLLAGSVVGGWQLVKFGGGIAGGLAWALLDALSIARQAPAERPAAFRAALRSWGLTAVVGLGLELMWVVTCVMTLTSSNAHDVLWPAFMIDAYEGIPRLPGWPGAKFFLVAFVPLITFSAFSVVGLGRLARAEPALSVETSSTDALLLGPLFFAVALTFYVRHEHLFLMAAWSTSLGIVWAYRALPRIAWLLTVVACGPALLVAVKVVVANRPPETLERFDLPGGEVIHGTRDEVLLLRALEQEVSKTPPGEFCLGWFAWGGGGFHHYWNRDYDLRSTMLVPWGLRPQDRAALLERLDRVAAILVPGQATDEVLRPVFRDELMRSFHERFFLDRRDDVLTVWRRRR